MTESFDEFQQRRAQENEDHEMLTTDAKVEWAHLKGFTKQFADDNRRHGDQQFVWAPYSSTRLDFMVLDSVAVTFLSTSINGIPQDLKIRFDRRPPAAREAWIEERSAVAAEVWSLWPVIKGSIVWDVDELGEQLSSLELADRIATHLAEYYDAYKEAYTNWLPS